LIDEVNGEGAIGRSYMDAPEVDGKVYLTDEFDVQPGDQVWVQIIHADEHDVWGVRVKD
jgi:ribosomal protein S12 methylthiotransferase